VRPTAYSSSGANRRVAALIAIALIKLMKAKKAGKRDDSEADDTICPWVQRLGIPNLNSG
jgi:hypothetical protein